jgi:paraquat-inducible protein B
VNGVKPGQTPVRYRGANVGEVTSVALSEDLRYAVIEAKLRRNATALAREGSSFWLVRPHVGRGDISGLGTIITGPYIEVLPGQGKAVTEFTGFEHSPMVLDPRGLNVVLLSGRGESLRAGVPIYYRGIEVGAVRETRLSTNAAVVEIACVIRRNYAPLVRPESKFWNVTGLDVRVGLFRGAEVNVESLKSLLIGGIAFATPDDFGPEPARDGMIFRLYDQPETQWSEWTPRIAIVPEEPGSRPDEIVPARKFPLKGVAPP